MPFETAHKTYGCPCQAALQPALNVCLHLENTLLMHYTSKREQTNNRRQPLQCSSSSPETLALIWTLEHACAAGCLQKPDNALCSLISSVDVPSELTTANGFVATRCAGCCLRHGSEAYCRRQLVGFNNVCRRPLSYGIRLVHSLNSGWNTSGLLFCNSHNLEVQLEAGRDAAFFFFQKR
ncbi:hypothetical protein BS78_07G045500 [Paspalum vaginatum]|nr:hypothetical protein BS78_07G045500 [Paspalum vaginatum]